MECCFHLFKCHSCNTALDAQADYWFNWLDSWRLSPYQVLLAELGQASIRFIRAPHTHMASNRQAATDMMGFLVVPLPPEEAEEAKEEKAEVEEGKAELEC